MSTFCASFWCRSLASSRLKIPPTPAMSRDPANVSSAAVMWGTYNDEVAVCRENARLAVADRAYCTAGRRVSEDTDRAASSRMRSARRNSSE